MQIKRIFIKSIIAETFSDNYNIPFIICLMEDMNV
jgi:hypothetical protein